MERQDGARPPGRPRREETDALVLAAARSLVTDRGYPRVTVAMIASEAGVAKQTLYRRWPGKAEIVLDAFLNSAAGADVVPYEGLEPTLTGFLAGIFAHLEQDGAAIRNLIASAQSDRPFLERFRDRFAQPRAAALMVILREAEVRGDLPPRSDLAMLSDMIHGAFWYRLLLGEALDRAYAERLAASVALPSG